MIYEKKKFNSPLNITWNQSSMKKYWLDERFYYYYILLQDTQYLQEAACAMFTKKMETPWRRI